MQHHNTVHFATPHACTRHAGRGVCLAVIACVISGMKLAAAEPVNAQAAASRACAGSAVVTQRINLSSGVYTSRAVASSPLYLDVPLGTNAEFYDACLQREGFAPRDQVSAEFARVAACKQTAQRKVVLVRRAPGSVHIASNIDVPDYTRCVNAAITVEAEIPAATK